jgi:hypothetical protein
MQRGALTAWAWGLLAVCCLAGAQGQYRMPPLDWTGLPITSGTAGQASVSADVGARTGATLTFLDEANGHVLFGGEFRTSQGPFFIPSLTQQYGLQSRTMASTVYATMGSYLGSSVLW